MVKDKIFVFAARKVELLIIISRLIMLCWHLHNLIINMHLNSRECICISHILYFKDKTAAQLK